MQTLKITPEKLNLTAHEHQVTLPQKVGYGGVSMMRFNTGIRLSVSDYQLNSATTMEYVSSPSVFGFGFCLSGEISSQPAGFKSSDRISSGRNALFHFNGDKIRETIGTKRVLRLNIMLEPERMHHLFQNAPEEIVPLLHDISCHPQRLFGSLTSPMRDSIRQILACPYNGVTREFYLESKALELVAYKLDQLQKERSQTRNRPEFKDEDLDRAKHAGKLIVQDLETPPGLADLARQVGMCQSRLCRCFKKVYGMTPFDYLRSKRLEIAERRLRQGQMNVTQVAFSVGYSSLSHFTKAFKQHAGILPSQCQGQNPSISHDQRGFQAR